MLMLRLRYCDRLDTWESEQNEWTATLMVLKHFQALYECASSSSARGTDDCDNVAVKKRKIDANNKNYKVAGMNVISVSPAVVLLMLFYTSLELHLIADTVLVLFYTSLELHLVADTVFKTLYLCCFNTVG